MTDYTANLAWFIAYRNVHTSGQMASPRGQETMELLHQTHKIDMRYPLVTIPERKLNYRFAAAEALWILEGSERLTDLLPYNARMADYSDNGETLAGAYGPRIESQMGYIVKTLKEPDTRQATLTIWTPNPGPSKDIPCTVAMDFKIRGNQLHTSVFMRSSDVWLGLPYDIFSFCCLSYQIVGMLRGTSYHPVLEPGFLHITAASSHVYAKDAGAKLQLPATRHPAPPLMWDDPIQLHNHLSMLTVMKKGDPERWWE